MESFRQNEVICIVDILLILKCTIMKKLLTHLFVLACIVAGFSSCEQGNLEEMVNEPSQVISFKYHGETYIGTYQVIGKNIIYNNKDIQKIQKELANNPNLATFVDEKGNVEYFSSYDELRANIPSSNEPPLSSVATKQAAPIIANLSIYSKAKYKGSSKTFNATAQGMGAYYTNLSAIGFSKNISSLKLKVNASNIGPDFVHVTLWDQVGYKGHSITWRVSYSHQKEEISNLNDYMLQIPLIATWDKAAQSLSFGLDGL